MKTSKQIPKKLRYEFNLVNLLLEALTVIFFCALFPPVSLWWLGYVALVPWLILVLRTSTKAQLILSYIIGLIIFLINVHWIRPITLPGYISMCLYFALYWPLAGLLIQQLHRNFHLPVIASAPIGWVICEYIRSLGPLGFQWFYLGHSQVSVPVMIQIADIAGVYAVSFVLVLVNVAIAGFIASINNSSLVARSVRTGILAMALISATFFYGQWRLHQHTITIGPKLAVVQEDFPMFVDKDIPGLTESLMAYLTLSINAAEHEHPDMIIWPETCIPISINPEFLHAKTDDESLKSEQAVATDVVDMLGKHCRESNAMLILGALSKRINPPGHYPAIDKYNSALIFNRKGKYVGRYDKIRLVLFGEYVPFRYTIPRLYWFLNENMTPYGKNGFEYSLTPGTKLKRFSMTAGGRKYNFAIAICYEDTMADLIADFVAPINGKKQIDFLVNISNDGWFNHSAELPEHLDIARFRAVENRISIARAVNTGISAIITPNGKIQQVVRTTSMLYGPGVRGYVADNIEIDSRVSIYSRIKDIPLMLLTIVVLLAILIDWLIRFSKRRRYEK